MARQNFAWDWVLPRMRVCGRVQGQGRWYFVSVFASGRSGRAYLRGSAESAHDPEGYVVRTDEGEASETTAPKFDDGELRKTSSPGKATRRRESRKGLCERPLEVLGD